MKKNKKRCTECNIYLHEWNTRKICTYCIDREVEIGKTILEALSVLEKNIDKSLKKKSRRKATPRKPAFSPTEIAEINEFINSLYELGLTLDKACDENYTYFRPVVIDSPAINELIDGLNELAITLDKASKRRRRYFKKKGTHSKTEKTCVVCQSKFMGTTRRKYCSTKCSGQSVATKYGARIVHRHNKHWPGEPLISLEKYSQLVAQECYWCGEPSTGLDRIDNAHGYSEDNVHAACGTCNVMRNKLSTKEFLDRMIKIVARHTPQES